MPTLDEENSDVEHDITHSQSQSHQELKMKMNLQQDINNLITKTSSMEINNDTQTIYLAATPPESLSNIQLETKNK